MKYIVAGLLLVLALPALAEWNWEGRDEWRRSVAAEARRHHAEVMREAARVRADARREAAEARRDWERQSRRLRDDWSRESRRRQEEWRSEEHTSELQSHSFISYAV